MDKMKMSKMKKDSMKMSKKMGKMKCRKTLQVKCELFLFLMGKGAFPLSLFNLVFISI